MQAIVNKNLLLPSVIKKNFKRKNAMTILKMRLSRWLQHKIWVMTIQNLTTTAKKQKFRPLTHQVVVKWRWTSSFKSHHAFLLHLILCLRALKKKGLKFWYKTIILIKLHVLLEQIKVHQQYLLLPKNLILALWKIINWTLMRETLVNHSLNDWTSLVKTNEISSILHLQVVFRT